MCMGITVKPGAELLHTGQQMQIKLLPGQCQIVLIWYIFCHIFNMIIPFQKKEYKFRNFLEIIPILFV